MSVMRIMRGTAALPPDLEERFRRAYGREMNQQERRFFGLKPRKDKQRHSSQRLESPRAA
jgi:hypothetical protein